MARSALFLTAMGIASGCTLLEISKVRETDAVYSQYAYVSGTVSWDLPDATWVVVYIETVPCDEDWDQLNDLIERGALPADSEDWTPEIAALTDRILTKRSLAEHFVRNSPGFWYSTLAPGCYGAGAFADLDRNYRYDDEPVARIGRNRLFELRAGDRHEGISLVIDPNARLSVDTDPLEQQIRLGAAIRSHGEQLLVSMSQVSVEGEVIDLADPRFGPANGRLGYYQTYRFLAEVRPGVFFLEPYDPRKIPVLFVHGALGFPQNFTALVENLDRSRYQPWMFFYPSGESLGDISHYMVRTLTSLRLRHGFERLAVVAHSMGGLLARDFVLRQHAQVRDDPVRVLVTLSTPWGGVPSAESGVERSPYVVPSWNDIRPASPFLANLFFEDPTTQKVRRSLPANVPFHLLFGVEDDTVPVSSTIRWEAARDAEQRWPLPYGHVDILDSVEASTLLGEILAKELP